MTTDADLRTGTRMSLDEFLAPGETDGNRDLVRKHQIYATSTKRVRRAMSEGR